MNRLEDSSGGRIRFGRGLLAAFLAFCLVCSIIQSQVNAAGDVTLIEITPGASGKTTEAFEPNPINIDAGDTVVWTNDDSTPHTVTSGAPAAPDGNFDSSPGFSPLLVPQATFSHTFIEAGNYPYYCGLHPNMVGTVIVDGGSNVFGKIEVPSHVTENVGFTLSIIDNDLNVDSGDIDGYSFNIDNGEMTAEVLLAGESALEIRVNGLAVTMTNALSIPFEETGDDTGVFVPDLPMNQIDTSMFASDEEGPIEDGDVIDFVYSDLAYDEAIVSTTIVGTKLRTHLTLNPVESVVPNSNITVSGILRDLGNWTGLSGRQITIDGNGVPSQQIATTAGIVFEGLMEIRTCETQLPSDTSDGSDTQTIDDDVYPECLPDEGDADDSNSVLHLGAPSAGLSGGTITFPPGITNVELHLQNMGNNQVTVGIEHATGLPSMATSIGYCPDVADFNLISSREIRQIQVLGVASDPNSNSIFPQCNTPGDQTVGISRIETSNIDGNPEARYVFDFEDLLPGSLPNQMEMGAGSFYATFEAQSAVQNDLGVQASFGGDNSYLPTQSPAQSYNTIEPTVDLATGAGGPPTSGIVPDTGVGITTISCIVDGDKDGLCNSWESIGSSAGIPYKVGSTTQHYKLSGDLHLYEPDIYVEIDYMGDNSTTTDVNESHRPIKAALDEVMDVLSDRPTPIYLHYFIDDDLPHEDALNVWLDTDGNPDNDFYNIKQNNFGTDGERSQDINPLIDNNLLKAKAQAYHYALFAHSIGPCPLDSDLNGLGTPSGLAEVNGNDFIVSLGCGFGPNDSDPKTHSVGTQNEQAGTFMHELGHNLGLDHGGPREFLELPTGYAISGPQVNAKMDYAAGDSTRSFTIRNVKVVTPGPSSGTLVITATLPLSPDPNTVNVGTVTRSYNPAYPIRVDSITPIVSEHSGGATTVRQINLKVDYTTTASTTTTTGNLGTFTVPFTVTNTASVLGNPTTPFGTPILSVDISSTDYTENCKPNYPSVMSYSQQFSTFYENNTANPYGYVWHPTYSNWTGPDLNEAALNETAGLGGNNNYIVFHNGEAVRMASTADPEVDWSAANGPNVQSNINNLGGEGCESQTLDVLKGFDDWSNLNFDFKKGLASIDGVYPANTINVFWREGTYLVLVDDREPPNGGGRGGQGSLLEDPLVLTIIIVGAGAGGIFGLNEYRKYREHVRKREYLDR